MKYKLVAENTNPIAFAHFKPIGDGYDIIDIRVAPAFRQKGIARAMITDFIEKIKPKSIMLEVRQSNTPAINLYKSLGFAIIAERKNYYKCSENALIMQLTPNP